MRTSASVRFGFNANTSFKSKIGTWTMRSPKLTSRATGNCMSKSAVFDVLSVELTTAVVYPLISNVALKYLNDFTGMGK
jgi:hypothetical protein